MPVQRTFMLIRDGPGPGAAAAQPPPSKPMTSRQVRKAYQAANRMPTMSRTERIRQERADQERIRKELDKERAAARAKAARDKKRERETREREEKRRLGLPLANVRPSQDTIAKFVRGNGSGNKRDAAGRRVEKDEQSPVVTTPLVDEPVPVPIPPQPAMDELDLALEEDEELFSAAALVVEASAQQPRVSGPTRHALDEIDLLPDDDEIDLNDLEQLQPIKKAPKTSEPEPAKRDASLPALRTSAASQKRPVTPYELDLGLRQAQDEGKSPPKHFSPEGKAAPLQRPRTPSPAFAHQSIPSGTQAILFHCDDFFPSSSQQERELQEELKTETKPRPSPAPPRAAATPARHHPAAPTPPTAIPKRFFTPSGDQERLSLAMQRSRRTAALQEIQQNNRLCPATRSPAQLSTPHGTVRPLRPLAAPPPPRKPEPLKTAGPGPPKAMMQHPDRGKENEPPPPPASQESEYGGDWVDEIALELTI
ncbi:hypothetical protein HIM_03739 [Hirsutella minnesotensis 3608]|uniref:Uncharacterized protein n=1 Tax=Hirsutella minnesotensis 3608 TaxID=1043627 RepID=A0A0F8A298_9HYPO|nr:hypothetical protein HIM_03739 [Hirsutella minnesotensis 3608]